MPLQLLAQRAVTNPDQRAEDMFRIVWLPDLIATSPVIAGITGLPATKLAVLAFSRTR